MNYRVLRTQAFRREALELLGEENVYLRRKLRQPGLTLEEMQHVLRLAMNQHAVTIGEINATFDRIAKSIQDIHTRTTALVEDLREWTKECASLFEEPQ